MTPSNIEVLASVFFALAVAHTFAVSRFQAIASKYPRGSVGENIFHLLGEVEVVFGFWAGLFVLGYAISEGHSKAIGYAESLNFTEPLFVFAIMATAATRPIVSLARSIILAVSRFLPGSREVAVYASCLVVGPILGSLITEPAAMTVTALILKDRYYGRLASRQFKYLTIATLFVNVSIGGVLTHFAAPPVLMVAGVWNWGLSEMFSQFGWKATIAVVLNAALATMVLRREIAGFSENSNLDSGEIGRTVPIWLTGIHTLSLALMIISAHHPVIFIGLFLFFLGLVAVTSEHQDYLRVKESLLVAFFLGGLVVLGTPQRWWIEPIIVSLNDFSLFLGSTILTAFTDNAAITFLGSQIPEITDSQKYALVAGAVAGGGLTVIANAPNPAGYAILSDRFGEEGVQPFTLFAYAIVPTLISLCCFWIF